MFCPSCGTELDEDALFCAACGAPVEERLADGEGAAADLRMRADVRDAQPGETVPAKGGREKKPRRWLPWKRIVLLVAVVAVLALLIARFRLVKESVLRLFTTPESYTRHVLRNNLDLAEDIASSYEALRREDRQATQTVSLLLSEDAIDDIEGWLRLAGASGVDLEALSNVSASVSVASRGDMSEVKGSLSAGRDTLASADLIYDSGARTLYGRIPEFNEDYFAIDFNAILEQDMYYTREQVELVSKALPALEESLPSSQEIQRLYRRYLDVAIDQIQSAERQSTTVKFGDVSQRMTELTIEIDEDLVADIITAVCEEMLEDEELEDIIRRLEIEDLSGYDGDELWDRMEDALEELADQADRLRWDEEIELTLYVSRSGRIQGLALQVEEGRDTVLECSAVYAVSGTSYAAEASAEWWGERLFAVEGDGKRKGDAVTADFTVKAGDRKLKFSVEALDLSGWARSEIKGKIRFDLGQLQDRTSDTHSYYAYSELSRLGQLLSDYTLQLELAASLEETAITVSLQDKRSSYISVALTNRTENASAIRTPGNAQVTELASVGDVADYLADGRFAFFTDIVSELGLPREVRYEAEDWLDDIEDDLEWMEGRYNIGLEHLLYTDDVGQFVALAPTVTRIASRGIALMPAAAGLGAGAIVPLMLSNIDQSRISADRQRADTIAAAIQTALCDPDVVVSGDFSVEDYDHWTDITQWDVNENVFTRAVADILGVRDFSELRGQLVSGGCTGQIDVCVQDWNIYVVLRGSHRYARNYSIFGMGGMAATGYAISETDRSFDPYSEIVYYGSEIYAIR